MFAWSTCMCSNVIMCHATLIFIFSLQNDQQRIVKPICFTILWLILAGHAPTFLFLVSIIHLMSCLFSLYLMSPPNHCIESIRRSFPDWSTFLLIHLSFYSVCFLYIAQKHILSSVSTAVRSLRSFVFEGFPCKQLAWVLIHDSFSLSLFRSACLSMTSPSVVHHKGENEREASVCSSTGVPGRQCWSTWKHYSKSHDWSLGQIPFHLREGSRVATKVSRFGCMFLLP